MKTSNYSITGVILLFFLFCTLSAKAQFPDFPPDDVTRTMDRDQMLWQLGDTFPALPSKLDDPNSPPDAFPSDSTDPEGNWTDDRGTGNTITRSGWGLWNNYHDYSYGFFPGPDSLKTGDYTPIDLLQMNDGTVITSQEEWWTMRRPELFDDVQREVWGTIPHDSILPEVTWTVEERTGGTGSHAYIEKVITGIIDTTRYPEVRNVPVISASYRVPVIAADSVPMMVVIGGGLGSYWDRTEPNGWGVCTFDPNAIQPDNGSGLSSYLIGLCNKGNWRQPEDWGSLAAWAWGIHRLIDYFETDPLVDATKVGVTGHSRYGKATLVTMAYDERVFIAFPSDAGALGTAMNRRHWGQNIENSGWDQEYHWCAGNFMKYCGELNPGDYMPRKVENMPVDAHSLVGLCAPRPVYMNCGNMSTWIDPYGVYLTAVEATPVYEFLGATGVVMNDELPEVEVGYIDGDIGYRYHDGGHTDAPDWPDFWRFALKYVDMPVLWLSENALTVADTAGENVSFNIESDTSWTISYSADWITVDHADGSGDDSINVSIIGANPDDTARQAMVIISAPRLEDQVVYINQNSANPSLAVSDTAVFVGALAGSNASFEVVSTAAWSISADVNWISSDPSGGINNDSVLVIVDENTSVDERTGTIMVAANGVATQEITVVQEGAEPFMTVFDPGFQTAFDTIELGSEAGNLSMFISTNSSPMANSSEVWATPSTSPFFGNFWTLNIPYEMNTGSESRATEITVMVDDLQPRTFHLVQSGISSTRNIGEKIIGKVYPNPNDGNFQVELSPGYQHVFIYNMQGRTVQVIECWGGTVPLQIPGNEAGLYILEARKENQSDRTLILKQ